MSRPSQPPFICVTCEAEIRGRPTFYVGLAFCCAGCVANGPCTCSYDDDPAEPAASPTETMTPAIVRELVGAPG